MLEIKVEKILVAGEKKLKFISCSGWIVNLPKKYLEEKCYVSIFDKTHIVLIEGYSKNHIYSGELMSRKDIEFIRKCGKRLGEINKQLKKENEKWHGEITYVI